ncbi:MAG: protein-glutamate O-methyltransferase CheR [Tepidanaerobacteraceae bacterium]|nr:protein-glutamate O-methyltransferase CheR [Tepidanaerobacteraceae bacterium]
MDGYKDFTGQIKDLCKIDLSEYKEKQMKRRIESLIKRNGLSDYNSYFNLLKNSDNHLKEFLDYITINVSEFFRNPTQWIVLENEILPTLISKKKKLKIWSSACASGEEPYSVALLLAKMGILTNADVIATDIDTRALEDARAGVYPIKSVVNIPAQLLDRYFIRKDDIFILKEEIKKRVSFSVLNLLNDKFPRDCDLIICRNVMIYFTEEAKDKLYKKFYDAMLDEGILFVGSTEQIITPQKYGFVGIKSFFYKKVKLH